MTDTTEPTPVEHIANAGPHAADDEESILRELNAALEANPELRAVAPAEGEWEDFDRLLAENPEFAAPVAVAKDYYKSKDKWDCGHEGQEVQTEIERDPNDDTLVVLINEVRGICEACMAKWLKLEEPAAPGAGNVAVGGSSSGPAGPPGYNQAQSVQELEIEDDNDLDDGRLVHGALDIDDGPGKGKGVPGAAPRPFEELASDEESLYSDPGDPNSNLPGLRAQPAGHTWAYESDEEDHLVPVPLQVRGHGGVPTDNYNYTVAGNSAPPGPPPAGAHPGVPNSGPAPHY